MSYCTHQDLIDRFGEAELIQRTDRTGTGVIDTAVLDKAIADADAEINGFLGAYPLPLMPVPANFVRMACDMTRYYLYDDMAVDPVQKRYDNAIKYLTQVAAGKIGIGPDTAGAVVTMSSAEVQFDSSPSVFRRDA